MASTYKLSEKWCKKIIDLMARQGIRSDQELANKITDDKVRYPEKSISRSNVQKFRTGKPIIAVHFCDICDVLDLDVDEVREKTDGEQDLQEEIPQSLTLPTPHPQSDNSTPVLFSPGPLLHGDSHYADRKEVEHYYFGQIVKPRKILVIKGPRFTGKTSLIYRIQQFVENVQEVAQLVYFDVAALASSANGDYRSFLEQLTFEASDQLHDDADDIEFDASKITEIPRFKRIMGKQALQHAQKPVILAFDNFEGIFPYEEYRQSFFELIRHLYEQGIRTKYWEQVNYVIAYSTEPYFNLDPNKSPFNIGNALHIELADFSTEEILALGETYNLTLTDEEVSLLIDWLGGQPYLTDLTLKTTADTGQNIKEIFDDALSHDSIYYKVLSYLLGTLVRAPELTQAYQLLLSQTAELDNRVSRQLIRLGIIRVENRVAKPRYRLYEEFFRQELING